jgi:hypothetical protein
MKTERLPTRDVREDRCEREEKLGQAMETLPGKTRRDRLSNSRVTKTRVPSARVKATVPESARSSKLTLPIGVSGTRKVWFRLSAPAANRVCVAGTFNEWNPTATPLVKGKEGEWRADQELVPGEYEYRFVVDGTWQEDPDAKRAIPNPFGSRNSILHVA